MADKENKSFKYLYTGVIDGKDGAWGVVVPEIEGCVGAGDTIEEAVEDATKALSVLGGMMQADGEAIPAPQDIEDVKASYEADGGEWGMVYRIPLLIDEGRSVRVNVSMDARMLRVIDKEAELRGVTRSAFLASAAFDKISAAG